MNNKTTMCKSILQVEKIQAFSNVISKHIKLLSHCKYILATCYGLNLLLEVPTSVHTNIYVYFLLQQFFIIPIFSLLKQILYFYVHHLFKIPRQSLPLQFKLSFLCRVLTYFTLYMFLFIYTWSPKPALYVIISTPLLVL